MQNYKGNNFPALCSNTEKADGSNFFFLTYYKTLEMFLLMITDKYRGKKKQRPEESFRKKRTYQLWNSSGYDTGCCRHKAIESPCFRVLEYKIFMVYNSA